MRWMRLLARVDRAAGRGARRGWSSRSLKTRTCRHVVAGVGVWPHSAARARTDRSSPAAPATAPPARRPASDATGTGGDRWCCADRAATGQGPRRVARSAGASPKSRPVTRAVAGANTNIRTLTSRSMMHRQRQGGEEREHHAHHPPGQQQAGRGRRDEQHQRSRRAVAPSAVPGWRRLPGASPSRAAAPSPAPAACRRRCVHAIVEHHAGQDEEDRDEGRRRACGTHRGCAPRAARPSPSGRRHPDAPAFSGANRAFSSSRACAIETPGSRRATARCHTAPCSVSSSFPARPVTCGGHRKGHPHVRAA